MTDARSVSVGQAVNESDRGGERWNEGVRKRFENERGRFEGESTRTGNIDFDEDVSITIF